MSDFDKGGRLPVGLVTETNDSGAPIPVYPSWHTEAAPKVPDPAQAAARRQKQKRRKMQKASRKANRA